MSSKYNRELRWIEIRNCEPDTEHIIYNSVERKDLNISVGKSGVIQPFTGIVTGDKVSIIDGRERLRVAKEKFGQDHEVPVWVILDSLTDEQIKYLMLDLERTRRKTYVDRIAEYELYNKLIPNRQGQDLHGEKNRTQVICGLMGICKSQLMKLIKIDRISPTLLEAVDNDLITLEGARRKAEEIERNRKKEESEEITTEPVISKRRFSDKVIDLESFPRCCPHCNNDFSTLRYEDILNRFNVNRKEDEFQTDWLRNVA